MYIKNCAILIAALLLVSCLGEIGALLQPPEPKPLEYQNLIDVLNQNEKEKDKLTINQNLINLRNLPVKIKVQIVDVEAKSFDRQGDLTEENCKDFFDFRNDIVLPGRIKVGVNTCSIVKRINYKNNTQYTEKELGEYYYPNVVYKITTKLVNDDYPFEVIFYSNPPQPKIFDFNLKKQKLERKNYFEPFTKFSNHQIFNIKGIISFHSLNNSYIQNIKFVD